MANKKYIHRSNPTHRLATVLAAASLVYIAVPASGFYAALAQSTAVNSSAELPSPPALPSDTSTTAATPATPALPTIPEVKALDDALPLHTLDMPPPPPAPPAEPLKPAEVKPAATPSVEAKPVLTADEALLPPPPPTKPKTENAVKPSAVQPDIAPSENPLDIPELPDAPVKNTDGTRKVAADPNQFLKGQELSPAEREAEIQKLLNEFSDQRSEEAKKRQRGFEIDFNKLEKKTAEGAAAPAKTDQPATSGPKSIKANLEKLKSGKLKSVRSENTSSETPSVDTRLLPERSRRHNYKTHVPPQEYLVRDLGQENEHLPQPSFTTDYFEFLYAAAYRGNLNGIRALIDKGVSPNQIAKNGFTPLMGATQSGQLDAVRLLLLRGADPSVATINGVTALHVAAANSSINTVKALLHMGANPYALTNSGQTPADIARTRGRSDVAQILAVPATPSLASGSPAVIMLPPTDTSVSGQPAIQSLAPLSLSTYEAPMPAPYVDADLPFPPVPLHKPANPLATFALPVMPATPVMPLQNSLPATQYTAPSQPLASPTFAPIDTSLPPLTQITTPRAADLKPELSDLSVARPVPKMKPYDALSPAEQKEWKARLADWKKADQHFSELRFEQKVDYNYRRKVLMQIFPKEFNTRKQLQRWVDFDQSLQPQMSGKYTTPSVSAVVTPPAAQPAYQNAAGTNQSTGLADRDRLNEVLANWGLINSRFASMNHEQRLRGNEQRRRLLDLLVNDSSTGTYAKIFAKLPQAEIEKFIATHAKWEKFEEQERTAQPDFAILMRPWGGETPTNSSPESRTRARLLKSVRDSQ